MRFLSTVISLFSTFNIFWQAGHCPKQRVSANINVIESQRRDLKYSFVKMLGLPTGIGVIVAAAGFRNHGFMAFNKDEIIYITRRTAGDVKDYNVDNKFDWAHAESI